MTTIRLFKGRIYGRKQQVSKDAKKLTGNKKLDKQTAKVERLRLQKKQREELRQLQIEENMLKAEEQQIKDNDHREKVMARKLAIAKRKAQIRNIANKNSRLLPNYGNLKKRIFK